MRCFTLLLVLALELFCINAKAESVTKLVNNGDSSNRVDIVILGDGYTAGELNKFKTDADSVVTSFFNEEPFKEYQNYFNVSRIDVISTESGADHPSRGEYKDTALDAYFDCFNIQRLICINTSKVYTVVNNNVDPNQADIVIVLVNDPEYGGSGGAISVASTHSSAVEVALHEMGHSFGLLADEYVSAGSISCVTSIEPDQANVTTETNRSLIKWNSDGGESTGWIASTTSIPTTTTTPAKPGLYDGGKYCESGRGMYRATYNSKMRSLGQPFEQVNEEQLVKRIYNFVSPIDSVTPVAIYDALSPLEMTGSATQLFTVTTQTQQSNSSVISWTLDGVKQLTTNNQYSIDTASLTAGLHTLEVKVKDNTDKVRNDPENLLQDMLAWTIMVKAKDTDGDGQTDDIDLDDDNDQIPDAIEVQFGLNKNDPSDAGDDLDRDGDSNLFEYLNGTALDRDTVAPVLVIPVDKVVNAQGLFTQVDLGNATANDFLDGSLIPSVDDLGPYTPGRHQLSWQVSDSAGNSSNAIQQLDVMPLASFIGNTNVAESVGGSTVKVGIRLNGDAPTYPVTVPFFIMGDATAGVDYDFQGVSQIQLTQGREAFIDVLIKDDGQTGEPIENLIISMGVPTNAVAGIPDKHTIKIVEGNVAPQLEMRASQPGSTAGQVTTIVSDKGTVVISAFVQDMNINDIHQYQWSSSAGLIDIDADSATFSFNPFGLARGVYQISATVTDNGVPSLESTKLINLSLITSMPILSDANDSDGDGIGDEKEGLKDKDGDGIADYLDAIGAENVIQGINTNVRQYLLETEPGLQIVLGYAALGGNLGQSQINDQIIKSQYGANLEDEWRNIGGLYDFIIDGLAAKGTSIKVVLPQLSAVPQDPIYRKFFPLTGWQNFIENADNALYSAAGSEGYCPPPGHADYVEGLIAGHWCVQLKIQDGGPNDIDGLVNGLVEDPSGVATSLLADGDLAPLNNRDGQISIADALVALRYALNLITPLPNDDLNHGDVAPVGSDGKSNPDGRLTVADALLILRIALALVTL